MNFLYILLALFIFGFLIFIHELGHFLVARLCGVKVLEFAIGMGPKILSKKSKKSGTVYSLRLFPIGGFVSMLGENGMEAVQGEQPEFSEPSNDVYEEQPLVNQTNDEEEKATEEKILFTEEDAKHAYCNQSVWKRMLISLAGPAMNVVLGFILTLVMIISAGITSLGTTQIAGFYVMYSADESKYGFQQGDYVDSIDGVDIHSFAQMQEIVNQKNGQPISVVVLRMNSEGTQIEEVTLDSIVLDKEIINSLFESSLSEQSGLQTGDKVLKVNNTSVHTYNELAYEVMNQGYELMKLTVERNGEKVVLENIRVPSYVENNITFGDLDFKVWREEKFDVGTVLKHTWFRSVSTVKMVYDSLFGIFSGRYGVEAVSGPVGITQTISQAAQTGALNVLYLVIVISINLGIMNLLPFPALDGGHLFIYVIEAIRRKPLKKELEGIINFIGLIILLSLAVIIAIKDIIAL